MLGYNIPVLKTTVTPPNPSSGFLKMYFKTDGKLYTLSSSGTETDITGVLWGAIGGTLSNQADLQSALNAREVISNKSTSTSLGASNTLYPSQAAVKGYVDTGLATKQNSLGFTPENVSNKSSVTSLGTSDSLYPTQNAVKAYVDAGLLLKQATLVSGTNIKTINGIPVIGSGDIVISGSISDGNKGDITISSSGTVYEINNGAVEIAMINASGTADGTTFLRGDNTWSVPSGSGDVSKAGTPANDQVGVWTGDGTIEGTSSLTFNGTTLSVGSVTVPTISSTSTFTNKTFDADGTGNSITNIENADIKSGAAIALNKLAATTASRALVSDASGFVTPATTTSTEIGYVNGVTSAIQTQLNAKQATITGGATTIVSSNLTASRALVSDGSGKVAVATTTSTEIGYVNGVTSAIQTQLNAKAPTANPTFTGTVSGITSTMVGLGNVDNTSDSTKNSATVTLTNKRVTRRLATTNAPGATPTTNTDNVDIMKFTGLNAAITSMTTNLSGTPVEGDKIEFIFLDDGTARAITWGASFAATTVPLPTTTVISTKLRVGFEWGGGTRDCIAVA